MRGPCSPCAAPPLAGAQASHPAPLWHPLRPTSRLITAIRGCGAPSAGSSVESFSPKTCLNRQFAFAIDGAACTAKHRCQSAWPPEHITGGNARGIPRAIGRGSPLITARHQRFCLPRRLLKFASASLLCRYTFRVIKCGTFMPCCLVATATSSAGDAPHPAPGTSVAAARGTAPSVAPLPLTCRGLDGRGLLVPVQPNLWRRRV